MPNKHDKNVLRVPCITKNGKLVSIKDCEICRNKSHCDTYITLIEESIEYIEDNE